MRDMIREYFSQMLEDGIDIESATENLIELVNEIASEMEVE